MSSTEHDAMSGITVDVDHNPYLAEGSGTVDAIVSITVGRDVARRGNSTESGRGHHPGLFDLDAVADHEVRRSEASHRGRHRRTGRRHPLRRRRRHRTGRPGLSGGGRDGTGEHGDQGCGGGGRRRSAAQRWDRDGQLARLHPRESSDATRRDHPRHPAHRRKERARDARSGSTRKSRSAKAHSVATAEEWEPTGASTSCDGSHRHCLGTVDIVADPEDLADDFAAMMRTSMGKSIPDVTLRLWIPVGARVGFVKQVAPTVEDLTQRRVAAGPQTRRIPARLLGRRGPRLSHSGRGRACRGWTREAGRARQCRCGRKTFWARGW